MLGKYTSDLRGCEKIEIVASTKAVTAITGVHCMEIDGSGDTITFHPD